ncbi:MAG: N-acetyltransferase [bacterium]|nr:N-acetyltransferase [bacterium]
MQGQDPVWIPPLLIDQKSRFSRKNPFYDHGEVEPILARDTGTGRIVGRVCAVVNRAHNEFHKDRVGFFGFFECVDSAAVARALLDHAGRFLMERGFTVMRGPANFSVNDEIGMLIEGFDTPPVIMMTHNPPYYNRLMEECGFVKAMDLLGYELHQGEISERLLNVGEKLLARLKLRVRTIDTKHFWRDVRHLCDVYNSAWAANWGFVPMTEGELKAMADSLRLIYDPRMVFFAETEDGRPVGFSLMLPDINVILKHISDGRLLPTGIFKLLLGRRRIHRARVLLMGVDPAFRGRGLDAAFYYLSYKRGTEAGYHWAEFSWILENNRPMNDALLAIGAKPYKKWRMWEKALIPDVC